jgi:hypothetical protein
VRAYCIACRYVSTVHQVTSPQNNWHVCYALALDGDPFFADLVAISAACVRRIYPACKITILTDDASRENFGRARRPLSDVASKIRSVGKFDGSPRWRSRFIKTQARSVIEGDFLYLDADTAPVSEFSALFECEAPFSAAVDRNRVNPRGGFPEWVVPDFDYLGWQQPTKRYLNSGVVFWKDCAAACALGQLWHENWLRYGATVDNAADQPAFNHSIAALGIEPKVLDDTFNARVGVSSEFAKGARIYHLLSGDERAEGTFIDEVLKRYRENGKVDFSLIDAAVTHGHPWIGESGGPPHAP